MHVTMTPANHTLERSRVSLHRRHIQVASTQCGKWCMCACTSDMRKEWFNFQRSFQLSCRQARPKELPSTKGLSRGHVSSAFLKPRINTYPDGQDSIQGPSAFQAAVGGNIIFAPLWMRAKLQHTRVGIPRMWSPRLSRCTNFHRLTSNRHQCDFLKTCLVRILISKLTNFGHSAGASEAIRLVRPEPYHFLLQALLLKRPNPV